MLLKSSISAALITIIVAEFYQNFSDIKEFFDNSNDFYISNVYVIFVLLLPIFIYFTIRSLIELREE